MLPTRADLLQMTTTKGSLEVADDLQKNGRKQARSDAASFLCSGRCFLVAFFIAIVVWQLFILPHHFDFLSAAGHLRDTPEDHLLPQWRLKHPRSDSIERPTEKAAPSFLAGAAPATPKTAAKPYYDIVALIFSTGRKIDRQRMQQAEETWLKWHGDYVTNLTMSWVFILCQGDAGTERCSGKDNSADYVGPCNDVNKNAVMLPCQHDYARLIGKGVAGYRYVAEHFDFKYVIKADVDSILDVQCAINRVREIPPDCHSWGLGLWRVVHDSKVFDNEPGAGKYRNPAYKKDTGNDWYPPYMTGWAMVWSGDVARFLGMAGYTAEGLHSMPRWRDTWTIEDAAIGTFIAGLNICRVSLAATCSIWTELQPTEFKLRDLVLTNSSEDVIAQAIDAGTQNQIPDFDGPLDDDIPNLGDLANVHVKSRKHCAAKCYLWPKNRCKAFEYSPKANKTDTAKNCQLVSRKHPRAGKAYQDFKLYIRRDV